MTTNPHGIYSPRHEREPNLGMILLVIVIVCLLFASWLAPARGAVGQL